VAALDVVAENGTLQWRVRVTDEPAAEAQLLPLVLADGRVHVLDYGRRHPNLEQVFVEMVEGGNDGR
jgi:hypothetical protein